MTGLAGGVSESERGRSEDGSQVSGFRNQKVVFPCRLRRMKWEAWLPGSSVRDAIRHPRGDVQEAVAR